MLVVVVVVVVHVVNAVLVVFWRGHHSCCNVVVVVGVRVVRVVLVVIVFNRPHRRFFYAVFFCVCVVPAVFGLRRILRGERGDGPARLLVRLVQAAGAKGFRVLSVSSACATSHMSDFVSA